jgi:hypothetical protein
LATDDDDQLKEVVAVERKRDLRVTVEDLHWQERFMEKHLAAQNILSHGKIVLEFSDSVKVNYSNDGTL